MGELKAGSVAFIGAGPGAADLITVRGLGLLKQADVVIHDALPGEELLSEVSSRAVLVAVGKRCGSHSTTQAEIHLLLVEHAKAGRKVVRLKGGDPGVFGRLGEETEHLDAYGIPWQIVPGVTAAVASGATAGFPLTHRSITTAVTFLTAHCADGRTQDLRPFVASGATLCLYMGAKTLPTTALSLVESGMCPSTPVALVSKASQPGETVKFVELRSLADGTIDVSVLPTPLLAVVGEVVRLGIPDDVRASIQQVV